MYSPTNGETSLLEYLIYFNSSYLLLPYCVRCLHCISLYNYPYNLYTCHITHHSIPMSQHPMSSGTGEDSSAGSGTGTGLQTRVLSTFLNELDGITSQDQGEEGKTVLL
jgi:hypothetical protein